MTAQGLIDTTEMYLRTVFELEEEGIVPLRARIAERLAQSGPTVSQTVARMERDGLLHVENDRQLALSEAGRTLATRVMRKHRLAECLLVAVIKLPWEEVHIEACRWEHVISESVERRLLELLDYPVLCPHGNVIPGLTELGLPEHEQERLLIAELEAGEAMTKVAAGPGPVHAVVRRISEQIQSDLCHGDAGLIYGLSCALNGFFGHAKLAQARNDIAVRAVHRILQQLNKPPLHMVGNDVLPAAGLDVDFLPRQADNADQQALGQPVLAHHPHRQRGTALGQRELPVALHREQPVPLHPGHGLADGRPALGQPLGDARAQRDDAFFLELEDRAKVHFGRIDQPVRRHVHSFQH